jgi:hypothetical protein
MPSAVPRRLGWFSKTLARGGSPLKARRGVPGNLEDTVGLVTGHDPEATPQCVGDPIPRYRPSLVPSYLSDHLLSANDLALCSRNLGVRAEHVGDELVAGIEALVLPQRELVSILRPPDVDASV